MKSIKELSSLKGRTALLTGGAGHLGSAMAHALAEQGANIALIDIDAERCAAVARRIADSFGTKIWTRGVDLSDDNALRAVPADVAGALGSLDIVVNCAALAGTTPLEGWATPFEKQSVETWRRAMDVNLTSAFVLSQAAAPFLRENRRGSIINIGSIYGEVGPDWRLYGGTALGNPAAYAASKGGLIQLTRWLATTLAPDIRANAISPGGVFRDHQNPFLERYIERTPMKRMAAEEDVIGAAVFLASDMSGYVTGHNLVVDGGWTAW